MSFRPLSEMQFSFSSLQDELNHLKERLWHAGLSTGPFDGQEWAPAIDLFEHGDHYTLFVEVPGVLPEEIEVTRVGAALTIRGKKSAPEEMGEEDRRLRGERRFGTFCRTIELPGDIEAEPWSAKSTRGVLKITIPKSEASRAKSIKIEIEKE